MGRICKVEGERARGIFEQVEVGKVFLIGCYETGRSARATLKTGKRAGVPVPRL